MSTLAAQPQIPDEIDWDDLCKDLNRKRCVLFLGPSLPVYPVGTDKLDFYSLASLHLSQQLLENNVPFDQAQSQNLYYIAQKFIVYKRNYRTRLEDEIADLYKTEGGKLKAGSADAIPALYKTILRLPWHTIVNMQPDNFFEHGLKPTEAFSYYHYKNKDISLAVDNDKFLVYNLFGALVKDRSDYRVDSLVLTEEDQVEFVRNLVGGDPKVPECVISRLDKDKTYIFLDCNLENWYFRLLMEMLKIQKDSHTLSPRHQKLIFSPPTVEFYKNRYGFVFINNNSEEFVNLLSDEYQKRYAPPPPPASKKIFIAYHAEAEDLARSLTNHLSPWVDKNVLTVWMKDDIDPGGNALKIEEDQFNTADSIVLLIDAQFLSGPEYDTYVLPALQKVLAPTNAPKVFAVISGACAWEVTPVTHLNPKYILPQNHNALIDEPNQDKVLKEIATSLTTILWE
jgi:hypothetical protein